jgi:hypothetical protein
LFDALLGDWSIAPLFRISQGLATTPLKGICEKSLLLRVVLANDGALQAEKITPGQKQKSLLFF